jgi:eukaryotic-like serine/threonine-protein kinase
MENRYAMTPQLLPIGRRVESPFTRNRYEVSALLGEGGFGQAYLANKLDDAGREQVEVCLKVTEDQEAWHREAYFGELLEGQERVIALWESFARHATVKGSKTMLYFLVFELAPYGTVAEYLAAGGNKSWSEQVAKREVIALLKVLDLLHAGSATHRDLTPSNIFVCGDHKLKMGDFGIARHRLLKKDNDSKARNIWWVTEEFDGLPADDVYLIGQLLGCLLRGDAGEPLKVDDLEQLRCSTQMETILRRALGPRQQRYADAFEMLQAFKKTADVPLDHVRSLKNKCVVFTGPLTITRLDATVLVLQSGGRVSREVTSSTDVVVVGARGRYRGGGHKGIKLRGVERLNKNGGKIHIIGEAEFRSLTRHAR